MRNRLEISFEMRSDDKMTARISHLATRHPKAKICARKHWNIICLALVLSLPYPMSNVCVSNANKRAEKFNVKMPLVNVQKLRKIYFCTALKSSIYTNHIMLNSGIKSLYLDSFEAFHNTF